ncbi:MAG: DUF3843 family protein [Planctomycetota bacterium]
MTYSAHRPREYQGQGDSHLPRIVRQLQKTLSKTQRGFAYDTLRLAPKVLGELAGILVDFAEDLHNGTGIWAAYEHYNAEFFGVALPLTSGNNGSDLGMGLHPDRFLHFLWVLYPSFIDGLTFSPTHQDLRCVADAVSSFLSKAFAAIPKESGVKAFLGTPNTHGWNAKRKLIWLGTHSFLFRTQFALYMKEQPSGRSEIEHTDAFICQECTRWSGLGAIDILAGALDISADDRKDLRSWYELHSSFYKILSVSSEILQAVNVINDQPYRIRINMEKHPFKPEQFIFGSLVPWRGEWYWSGEQKLLGDASKVDVDDLKKSMKRHSSRIVCRYSKEYEAQVRQRMSEIQRNMLAFHGGKDLVIYPDGLAMAADWQKEIREQWEARPEQEVKEVIERHGLKKGRAEMKLPQDLLEAKGGLGVFLNPDEGKEIMTHFTSLITGLKKKGEGLSTDQEMTIRGFFESVTISPRFVRRVLDERGDESVRTAFLLKGDLPNYWLDYLLRSRKGRYYRKRYPALAVV